MLKVSIVTISYNQVNYLEKAILSILNQDYPNKEYIIVDPGSTDGSREIIEKYRRYFHQIFFEPDCGPSDGLNKGFGAATGDILGFLNADDILMTNALSSIVDYFIKRPNMDVCSGHGFYVNEQDETLRPIFSNRYSLSMATQGLVYLVQPATYFRRIAYLKTNGFNVDNRVNWDGELWLDFAKTGAKFGRIEKYLACFRIYEKSISGSKGYKNKLTTEQNKIRKKNGYSKINPCYWWGLYAWDRMSDLQTILLRLKAVKQYGFRFLLKYKQKNKKTSA